MGTHALVSVVALAAMARSEDVCGGLSVYYEARATTAECCCFPKPYDPDFDIQSGKDGDTMECARVTEYTYCDNPYGGTTSYEYSETINNNFRKVTTSRCPNHRFTPGYNPSAVTGGGSTTTKKIPAYPMYSEEGAADLSAVGGAVGELFNGASFFSPYGGSSYGTVTDYSNSAIKYEGDTFDECGCHPTSNSNSYHCHIVPSCLLRQLAPDTYMDADTPSPQIGWAYDGFPASLPSLAFFLPRGTPPSPRT